MLNTTTLQQSLLSHSHKMSLSTLTQCSPHICSRVHPPSALHSHAEFHPPPALPQISWKRVLHATCVAGIATVLSQLVATPIDVGTCLSRAAAPNAPTNLFAALSSAIRQKGFSAAFAGLHLHALKRLPTKTLTVALFELGTQLVSCGDKSQLSAPQHSAVAVSSGISSMLLTYPLHLVYYSMRKGFTFGDVVQRARVQPRILYSGALPAVIGTLPSVFVDYMIYRSLRQRIEQGVGNGATAAAAIVATATATNLTGGFFSEPFKLMSKKLAVESVKSASCGSLRKTVAGMMKGGVGEFWRGFPVKSLRYTVSAVVSKTTVQQLRRLEPQVPANQVVAESVVNVAPSFRAFAGRNCNLTSYRVSRSGRYARCAFWNLGSRVTAN